MGRIVVTEFVSLDGVMEDPQFREIVGMDVVAASPLLQQPSE